MGDGSVVVAVVVVVVVVVLFCFVLFFLRVVIGVFLSIEKMD